MSSNTTTKLLALFTTHKSELEDKGLSDSQVFGVLMNKEFISKSGVIFTLKSTGLVNQIFVEKATEVDFDI